MLVHTFLLNTINKYLLSFWQDTNEKKNNTSLELISIKNGQNVDKSGNDSLKDGKESNLWGYNSVKTENQPPLGYTVAEMNITL